MVEAAEEDTVTAIVVEATVVAEAAGKRKRIDWVHLCIYGLCPNSRLAVCYRYSYGGGGGGSGYGGGR